MDGWWTTQRPRWQFELITRPNTVEKVLSCSDSLTFASLKPKSGDESAFVKEI
jgi:hypothetical protein